MGFAKIVKENPWLSTTPLVVKPDQLIKRRGKAGLLAVNKTWPEVQAWVSERMGKNQKVLFQRFNVLVCNIFIACSDALRDLLIPSFQGTVFSLRRLDYLELSILVENHCI